MQNNEKKESLKQETLKQPLEQDKDSLPSIKKGGNPISYPLIGTTIPICILIGFLIGYKLDQWLGTGPIFLIAFLLMGILAAYRQIFKLIKKD